LKHLDLFSGIGGFALAASWVWGDDHEIVSFCEIDPFCQKILKKHWPTVPIISDIRDVTNERIDTNTNGVRCNTGWTEQPLQRHRKPDKAHWENKTRIDLLTGGFPCQPFSCAGQRKGENDDRFLWPEMLRIIRELQPTWIIGENVAGIVNMALDQVLSELENEGYAVQAFIIPACAVDAPHRRDRVWIVAHQQSKRLERRVQSRKLHPFPDERFGKGGQDVADTEGEQGASENYREKQGQIGEQKQGQLGRSDSGEVWETNWLPEPSVGRVANGIPNRVDRLRGLGNAIVPQCVVPIMEAIKAIEAT
jgi:DNA (cytosine-5)-methyltransferase 1